MASFRDNTRSRLPTRLVVLVVVACSALGGCPRRFSAAARPPVESTNPEAKRKFDEAQQAFDQGELDRAQTAFSAFMGAYPDDPVTPLVRVYLARIALQRDQLAAAREQLEQAARAGEESPVTPLARFHLGIVQLRLGAYAEARALLEPFAASADSDTLPAVLAALARAAEALNDGPAAVTYLDRLHGVSNRPIERLHARLTLVRLIDSGLTSQQVRSIYDKPTGDTIARALAARHLIAAALATGDTAAAHALQRDAAALLATHGVITPTERGATDPRGPIGVLLPFSGRFRAAGQAALAGAAFASGSLGQHDKHPVSLLIRDSGQDAARAARELIVKDRVIALIGVLDGARASQVARTAARHRTPFLSLSGATAPTDPWILRLLPDNAHRARTLAMRALARHPRGRVAILAPDSAFGRKLAGAFAEEVTRRGGTVAAQVSYPPRTTTFGDQAKRLASKRFDVLFVPDSAATLGLIAPALAQSGLWSTAPGDKAVKGRAIQIVSTADGLSPRLLTMARRYLQGAILAPGYYKTPAVDDPQLDRYAKQTGHRPSLLEAFAADAVATVRSHLRQGVRTRQALLAALRQTGSPGLTGPLRFAETGLRADPPLLYQIRDDQLHRLK